MTLNISRRPLLAKQLLRLLSPIPWRLRERLHPLTHDRYLLEEVIFPALRSRRDIQSILFIGCETYTATYAAKFADRHFATLDVDPSKAKYGAAHHVVDTFANVGAHFAPGTLDAVICNGVIGWGLDRPDQIDASMRQSFVCLRPGGVLILGWNDIEQRRPVPLERIDGLRWFVPCPLPPFSSPTYLAQGKMRHVFSFYARPENGGRQIRLPRLVLQGPSVGDELELVHRSFAWVPGLPTGLVSSHGGA